MWTALAALLPLLPAVHAAAGFNNSADYASGKLGLSPTQEFKSLNSTPVAWNFLKYPEEGFKPGKFFLAPWGPDVARMGPYIFDETGDLVWDGTASPYNYEQAMTFAPFKYKGQDVLTLWQGEFSQAGYGKGYGLLLDTHYNVVANITSTVPGTGMDFHEFTLTDNGTALVSVYSTEPYNMTAEFGALAVNSSEQIMGGYFQEIDIGTGKALFTWRSLDHQDPHECYTTPEQTGTTKEIGWDYFHINSIEKDAKGNYLVSARHCHTLYYIDGKSGDVLWRLGGKNSTLAMGPGVEFTSQHYARWHGNGDQISLFDNGAGPDIIYHNVSRGILLQIDEAKKTAELVYEVLPFNRTDSESQGSMARQPDGDWLAGWGAQPWISEYSSTGPALTNGTEVTNDSTPVNAQSGDLLWAAQFGVGTVMGYRNLRANWTASPETNPDFVISGGSEAYMSWNGATEVASWEILAANTTSGAGLVSLLNVTRSGFETKATLPSTDLPVVQARAVSKNGTTLGFSSFVSLTNGSLVAPPSAAQSSQVAAAGSTAKASGAIKGAVSLAAVALGVAFAAIA